MLFFPFPLFPFFFVAFLFTLFVFHLFLFPLFHFFSFSLFSLFLFSFFPLFLFFSFPFSPLPSFPLWQTIVNDPVYKKIPRDVLLGPIDVDTRSRINLEGKLSEDLFVYYDIEQEPEMPGKYDVEIKYKDHHLQFFHLNANYKQGNYINLQKSLH